MPNNLQDSLPFKGTWEEENRVVEPREKYFYLKTLTLKNVIIYFTWLGI